MSGETPRQPPFNGQAIVNVLEAHRVKFIVIGAFAAIAQGAPIPPTQDIDVTPAADLTNLGRLSQALQQLEARVYTDSVPDGLPFSHTARSLERADIWNLVTRYGRLDVAFRPSGFDRGYQALVRDALRVRVGDTEVRVASLSDVIRSKEYAGRPKDLQVLPTLIRHQTAQTA